MYNIFLSALLLFVQPITIEDNFIVTYNNQDIAKVNRSQYSIPIIDGQIVDDHKLNQFVEKIEKEIYKPPVNATIDSKGEIIQGKAGIVLDKNKFREQFYSYFYGSGSKRIEIPKRVAYPQVDSELLSNIQTKLIGSYITYFNQHNYERTKNIQLATQAVNNYVIFPGETFSFNNVVGKRTKEKGYLSAPVIVKGELSEGIGGGICQLSSTLFNAVDHAGIKIVKRYSHTKSVSYVPPGRDATVSWYGPDFIFQNNYNQPVLIRAKTYNGKLVVNIYSSDVVNYKQRSVPRVSMVSQ